MHLGSEYCRRHLQKLRQADFGEAPSPYHTSHGKSGWVYFIKSLVEDGPVKIGYSRTPDIRIQELQVASPHPLTLSAVWRSKDAKALESKLHRKFRSHKMNGEWFRPSPDLMKLIEFLHEKRLVGSVRRSEVLGLLSETIAHTRQPGGPSH